MNKEQQEVIDALRYVVGFDGQEMSREHYAVVAMRARKALDAYGAWQATSLAEERTASPLTIAFVAIGAMAAIREIPSGILPAHVANHYNGQVGFVDAVTQDAWKLDVEATRLVQRGDDLPGVFAYEIAEPFGKRYARSLISGSNMQPDAIIKGLFKEMFANDVPTFPDADRKGAKDATHTGERVLFQRQDSNTYVALMPNGHIAITDGWQTDYLRIDGKGSWIRESDQLSISDDIRAFLDAANSVEDAVRIADDRSSEQEPEGMRP